MRLPLADSAKAEVATAMRIIAEDDKLPAVNGFAHSLQPPDSIH